MIWRIDGYRNVQMAELNPWGERSNRPYTSTQAMAIGLLIRDNLPDRYRQVDWEQAPQGTLAFTRERRRMDGKLQSKLWAFRRLVNNMLDSRCEATARMPLALNPSKPNLDDWYRYPTATRLRIYCQKVPVNLARVQQLHPWTCYF